MTLASTILEARGIDKRFPGVVALQDVDLTVGAGEVHGLVGKNGAGKSTLVKILSGALQPDAGSIHLDGRPLPSLTPASAQAAGIATVYQDQQLVPGLNVAENLYLGREPRTPLGAVDHARMQSEAGRVLAALGLQLDPRAPLPRLDMAQRQQLTIAKAVQRQGRVLLLDEPTAALNKTQADFLFTLVRRLVEEGLAVLYISHHLDEVLAIADTVTVLRDGRRVGTVAADALDKAELVSMMVGQQLVEEEARHAPAERIEAVLSATGLRLDPASAPFELAVRAGEVLGITGTLGSGAFRLARVLAGLERPHEGAMTLRKRPYAPTRVRDAVARGVVFLPEDMLREGLVMPMAVAPNVSLTNLRKVAPGGRIRLWRERRATREVTRELAVVPDDVEREVRLLSGGNRRKVLLARALFADAQVLVLEEPTQGVDVEARREIHRLLGALATEGRAIVLATTDLEELVQVCDRILVLRKGALAESFRGADTTPQALLASIVAGAAPAERGAP
ncbi:MAG: sugar ABC transporter ATP-binding protein [Deinococcales bacterium]